MFTYQTTIKLHETDAAGILFFGQQFKYFHDAYEGFLASLGLNFAALLKNKKYFLPIVHAQADYKQPLTVGDRLTICLSVGNVGKTSFTLEYRLFNDKKAIVGTGKTVHVAVAKITGKKIILPNEIREVLK